MATLVVVQGVVGCVVPDGVGVVVPLVSLGDKDFPLGSRPFRKSITPFTVSLDCPDHTVKRPTITTKNTNSMIAVTTIFIPHSIIKLCSRFLK